MEKDNTNGWWPISKLADIEEVREFQKKIMDNLEVKKPGLGNKTILEWYCDSLVERGQIREADAAQYMETIRSAIKQSDEIRSHIGSFIQDQFDEAQRNEKPKDT